MAQPSEARNTQPTQTYEEWYAQQYGAPPPAPIIVEQGASAPAVAAPPATEPMAAPAAAYNYAAEPYGGGGALPPAAAPTYNYAAAEPYGTGDGGASYNSPATPPPPNTSQFQAFPSTTSGPSVDRHSAGAGQRMRHDWQSSSGLGRPTLDWLGGVLGRYPEPYRMPDPARIESFPDYRYTHDNRGGKSSYWNFAETSDYIRRNAGPGRTSHPTAPRGIEGDAMYPDTYKWLPPDSAVPGSDTLRNTSRPWPTPSAPNTSVPVPKPPAPMSSGQANLMYESLRRTMPESEARRVVCEAGGNSFCEW